MISFTAGSTLFQTLTQNTSSANNTLYGLLANIEHRYLLQKYFGNEGSYSISTIGSTTQYLTAAPAINDVSATLSVAWPYSSCTTVGTFSDGEVRNINLTNGSTSITWSGVLTGTKFTTTATIASGDTSATLSTAWATTTQSSLTSFSDGSTKTVTFTSGSTTITWVGGLSQAVDAFVETSVMTTELDLGGVQFYALPPNYSKLKTVTITIGNLKWTLDEVNTREDWDKQNVFPYYADIPKNYFIYPGGDRGAQLGIWPIPSTTGNIITFNYKFRIPDLSIADYSTGTLSVSNGGTTVTGSGTSWTPTTNSSLESRWIQISQAKGDNLWYQVKSVDSTTSLTLYQPYQGITVSGGSYTLGQMPLIAEDFQDMLVFKALQYYFASVKNDPKKFEEYKAIYDAKLQLLSEYSGTNSVQVNLSRRPMGRNPNLFPYGNIGT